MQSLAEILGYSTSNVNFASVETYNKNAVTGAVTTAKTPNRNFITTLFIKRYLTVQPFYSFLL